MYLFFLNSCIYGYCFQVSCLRQMNHDYPKQIVLFRDGVGDGQLPFVVEHEVPQLLSAFQAVVPPFEPKFTMVVIQKRINARFFRPSVSVLHAPSLCVSRPCEAYFFLIF